MGPWDAEVQVGQVGLPVVALRLPFVGHSCQISDKHFCLTKEKENHSQKDVS